VALGKEDHPEDTGVDLHDHPATDIVAKMDSVLLRRLQSDTSFPDEEGEEDSTDFYVVTDESEEDMVTMLPENVVKKLTETVAQKMHS